MFRHEPTPAASASVYKAFGSIRSAHNMLRRLFAPKQNHRAWRYGRRPPEGTSIRDNTSRTINARLPRPPRFRTVEPLKRMNPLKRPPPPSLPQYSMLNMQYSIPSAPSPVHAGGLRAFVAVNSFAGRQPPCARPDNTSGEPASVTTRPGRSMLAFRALRDSEPLNP
jgi:hypothetical protein